MYDVAVLIPVLNDKQGLFRSLASIHSRSSLAVVVVDDGSSPEISMEEIENSLANSHHAILIRHEINEGIVAALNDGLTECRKLGVKYVARLDAGDACAMDRLDTQARFLDTNPEYVLIGGQGEVVDQRGQRRFLLRLPTDDRPIRKMMHNNTAFIHPAVMLRAESLWQMQECYTKEYLWAEDYDLFYRLLSCGKAANLDEIVVRKYDTDKSISIRNRKPQLLSRLRIQCRHFNPLALSSWTGVAKTLCLFVAPDSLIHKYRTAFWQ